jgi:putative DNA primase/helicase
MSTRFEPRVGTLLSEVQPESVKWLWNGRIPLGKVTMIDGDPGLGKSAITLDLAARVSANNQMPDGTAGAHGGVVLISAEDGLADTVRPRLEVAGADCSRILDLTSPNGQLFQIAEHLAELKQAIQQVKAVLVVIDPVMAFLPPKKSSNSDQETRQALTPLAKLAEQTGTAVILVRHLNKAETLSNALYRGGGSIAFIGLARSGLVVAESKRHAPSRALAMSKCNLAKLGPSLLYQIRENGGEISVEWNGQSQETATELLLTAGPQINRKHAEEFLLKELSSGPMLSKHLMERGIAEGFSDKTLHRARKELGITSHQTAQGWVCEPPEQEVRRTDGQVAKEYEITCGHA